MSTLLCLVGSAVHQEIQPNELLDILATGSGDYHGASSSSVLIDAFI